MSSHQLKKFAQNVNELKEKGNFILFVQTQNTNKGRDKIYGKNRWSDITR